MAHKFFKLPRLIQILILIIPVVGWIAELIIRWSAVFENFRIRNLIAALVFTFLGWAWVLCVLDIIWILLFKHLLWTKA